MPRRINLLCGRALLGAYSSGTTTIDTAIVEKAATEVFDKGEFATPRRWAGFTTPFSALFSRKKTPVKPTSQRARKPREPRVKTGE